MDDFSLVCFFALPVTISNIVGKSLIIVNRRFLQRELHVIIGYDKTQAIVNLLFSEWINLFYIYYIKQILYSANLFIINIWKPKKPYQTETKTFIQ